MEQHQQRDPLAGSVPATDGADHLAALRTAADGGDVAAALAAVRSGWFDLSSRHGEEVRVLLERFPLSTIRAQPLLAMMLGISYNGLGFHRMRALRFFALAVRAARAEKKELDPVDRALIRASESAAYRLLGRPRLSVKPARAAVEALDALGEEQRAGVAYLPRIYSQIGISLYYGGDVDAAMETFAKGLAASPTTPPSSGFGNLAMLAGIHALQGDIPEAQAHLDYARSGPWTDQQRTMYTGTFYRLAEAVVATERLDGTAALAHLDAMEHDRRSIEHWIAIAQVEGIARLVAGDPGRGLAELDAFAAMRGAEGRSASARSALARVRALLQLALGSPDAAAVILGRDLGDDPLGRIDRARVDLTLDRTGSALNGLRSIAGAQLTARGAAEAAALEAAILLRFSESPRARGVVDRLGSLLVRTRQRLALAVLPPRDLDRVVAALRAAGFAEVVEDVPLRSLLPELLPETLLSERELAVLAVLMDTGSVAEIASALVVSGNTVKTQLRSVYRKLGVSNREDAIAVAIDRHLLVERD
ncbi:LuxR C-terminal-related transcriptional regulator [uncultured Leifsonia sp.]|uniref:response regulator transcription factor n=1 Tax=uncultured Leifsonia sp. TaxID=340359 RepID=UPI0028D009EC|nr:LuxR C-terminal-related transcriptional regulator [uncultured Leifsonia sp.]